MASSTSHMNLTKPANSENYSVDTWNQNMQKIDDFCYPADVSISLDTTKVAVRGWGRISVKKLCGLLVINAHGLYALSPIANETDIATISGVSGIPTESTPAKVDAQDSAGIAICGGNTLRLINIQNTDKVIYFTLVVPLV